MVTQADSIWGDKHTLLLARPHTAQPKDHARAAGTGSGSLHSQVSASPCPGACLELQGTTESPAQPAQQLCLSLMDRGVDVYFFQGNHDVWTYSYFEELGMKRLVQPALVEIGGKVFCLGHGDGLGPVPFGYRVLRRIFHSRILQSMFSMLHPWIAFRLGTGWSKNNRLARHEQYVFKGLSEPLCRFAEEFSRTHKVDFFIFGHYHADVRMTLPSGAEFLILKDWLESSPYLYFDGSSITGGYSQKSE